MSNTSDKSFELISAAAARGRLAHAFLISGALGSGKERLASRVISLLKNGPDDSSPDIFGEALDASVSAVPALDTWESGTIRILRPRAKSRIITVEEIRDLEHTLQLASGPTTYKIGVITHADRLRESAENAFLKTLEEPPPQTLLMLLTAQPQRLLPTIRSRCVHIHLSGGRALSAEGGEDLVTALNGAISSGFGSPATALYLKAVFSEFLVKKKAEVESAAKDAIKEEKSTYRDSTDGTWLKDREKFHEAAAVADYLTSRDQYLDILLAWLADLIRVKTGSGGLDFPQSEPFLKKIAVTQTITRITQRVDALDRLRTSLETNAQEQLALEVGFLKAFS